MFTEVFADHFSYVRHGLELGFPFAILPATRVKTGDAPEPKSCRRLLETMLARGYSPIEAVSVVGTVGTHRMDEQTLFIVPHMAAHEASNLAVRARQLFVAINDRRGLSMIDTATGVVETSLHHAAIHPDDPTLISEDLQRALTILRKGRVNGAVDPIHMRIDPYPIAHRPPWPTI